MTFWTLPDFFKQFSSKEIAPVMGIYSFSYLKMGFPGGSDGKESCNAGDLGSIPGSEISPGGGHSNPLQYSCLENPIERGAWWTTVHGVTKIQTQLSDKAQHTSLYCRLQINFYHKHNFNLSELEEEN